MLDPKSTPASIDPDHLTTEQVQQLQKLLDQLCLLTSYTVPQLVQLDTLTRQVCEKTGYGELVVVIKQGHVSRFEIHMSAEALPDQQHSPME